MKNYSLVLSMLAVALCTTVAAQDLGDEARPAALERIEANHLSNVWRLHPKVLSGGQPEGEAGFTELKRLGIKTVISVDGARPEVELAKKHGLRYVHLPHGYDGIPESRLLELAKAVRDLPGPIYIHCHHGKHRSPAAASAACVSAGLIQSQHARPVLIAAGTSESYRGLYATAASARRIDDKVLNAVKCEFPAVARLPPMAEAMVSVEHVHDHLKLFAANQWRPIDTRPALDPDHEALLLREHFTELLRGKEVKDRSARFQALMKEGEAAAASLEEDLRNWIAADRPENLPDSLAKGMERIASNCTSCHKHFRDVPLSEKK